MNESYTLHVPVPQANSVQQMLGHQISDKDAPVPARITIAAASQFGVLRAFESLAHLVSLARPGRIMNAPVAIDDAPRFGSRGLMV